MALFKKWKPRTVVGKILKGTTIGVLGAGAIASGVGAIAGAVGGAGLLAGAASGIGTVVKAAGKIGSGTKTVLSKISGSAVKLVTGQSKEDLAGVRDVKKDARAAKLKLELVERYKKAGLSEIEAYAKAGVNYVSGGDIKESYGEDFLNKLRNAESDTSGGVMPKNNTLLYAGLGLAGLFLLPKILK